MIGQGKKRKAGVRSLAASTLAAAVGLTMAATPVLAAAGKPVCYSRKEMAAEQMVRLHTELMVIGLTCQSIFPEEKTFAKYQEFTVKNRKLISDAEGTLISHMGRTQRGNGTRNFDMYRTELANSISRRVGVIGSWSYCQQFIPRATSAVAMSGEDVALLVADEKAASNMQLSSRPLCDVKVASLPDPLNKVEPPRGKTKTTATSKAPPAKATAKAKPTGKVKTAEASVPETAPVAATQVVAKMEDVKVAENSKSSSFLSIFGF